MVKTKRPKKMETVTETKKHTAVYLPPDLLRRLGQYQLDTTGGLQRGRNEIIIQAIDIFLKKEKY